MTDSADNKISKALFWGCFIALVTTSFGFITRIFMFLDPEISKELLNLDDGEVGQFIGIQIWPFAISIIGFSLIIDKVGYKFSMIFAFACQIIWTVMGYMAISSADMDIETRKKLLMAGGFILALGNGTVEAFINPVVATMFTKAKTKWLNILHAGWPGGLVVAGMLVIFMEDNPWEQKLLLIAIPAIIYFLMLIKQTFPVQERVSAGVSYKDMLSEFGLLGGLVAAFVIFLQLNESLPKVDAKILMVICAAMAVALGVYTKSLGRPLMFILLLIMMPLATTEIGTDSWITGIMENIVKESASFHPGWVLVHTSVIMMVLRFFAGPIVHALSPLPILMISSVLAIAGLAALSGVSGVLMIFIAATLYALGKTFFWPTMLGIVSEQTPKGGALTLNAISGVGMLAVGVLGTPYIGALQEKKVVSEVAIVQEASAVPGLLLENGEISSSVIKEQDKLYGTIKYPVLQMDAVTELIKKAPEADQEKITSAITTAKDGSAQKALLNMTLFPLIMLIAYVLMFLYFRSKGGYKPLELETNAGSSSDD